MFLSKSLYIHTVRVSFLQKMTSGQVKLTRPKTCVTCLEKYFTLKSVIEISIDYLDVYIFHENPFTGHLKNTF